MANRWWTYQRTRFPILAHGPLIAVFSLSSLTVSSVMRGRVAFLHASTALVAFTTAFLFFLQLRIADEFKDYEDDSRYRPYRPVPRGLVTLRELGMIGVAAAFVQLGLTLWIEPSLVVLLLAVWLYLGLMTREFFVRDWLKAHPFTYLWSHMLIMPLIVLYTTGCDWAVAGTTPPRGLIWFLLASLFNGIVIEIGRKIRAPEDEEPGVETYTVLWGRNAAVLAWLGAMVLGAAAALRAAERMGTAMPVAGLLVLLLCTAAAGAWRFLRSPLTERARLFEPLSGLWTSLLYLALGAAPMLLEV